MKSEQSQIELPKGWSAYRKISHAASFFIQISWHSFSLSLFHLRASIRNSLLLVILFDLPFDADYQTPVQSTLRVSLSRREYLETSQFSYLPVYIRICTERVSPLAVPRKKRGNHFGILSGITNATSWEGYEANKRSK